MRVPKDWPYYNIALGTEYVLSHVLYTDPVLKEAAANAAGAMVTQPSVPPPSSSSATGGGATLVGGGAVSQVSSKDHIQEDGDAAQNGSQ